MLSLLAYITESRIIESYGNSIFTFLGIARLFSKVDASYYIHITSAGFNFSHILIRVAIMCLFHYSHLSGYEVLSNFVVQFHI